MLLYLSSYKLGNRIDVLKKWMKKHGNKIILIANSRDLIPETEKKSQNIKKDIMSLEQIGFNVKQMDLRNYFGKKKQLEKDLEGYFAFYVIGGNTYVLRKAMELSGFDEYIIKRQKDERYLYSGYSAGICVLAPKLDYLDIVDEPVNPYNNDKVLYEGLNILDFVPSPHYKSDHPESKLIDKEVMLLQKNKVKYKTLQDGDVIIMDLNIEKDIIKER